MGTTPERERTGKPGRGTKEKAGEGEAARKGKERRGDMNGNERKYLEAATKLRMAVTLALKKGKFSKDTKRFIQQMYDEVEELIGPLSPDIIEFLERYYD